LFEREEENVSSFQIPSDSRMKKFQSFEGTEDFVVGNALTLPFDRFETKKFGPTLINGQIQICLPELGRHQLTTPRLCFDNASFVSLAPGFRFASDIS
jgi:hypothetical protein